MSAGEDLKSYTTSQVDFYALLSLPSTFTQKDLDRAYRRTALKWHPDHAGAANGEAREKFHLVSIAKELFSNATLRSLYDNARQARERQQRKREQLDDERRKLREDLEGRERGIKRPRWTGDEVSETRLEHDIKRLAEQGRRLREEAQRKSRQEGEQRKQDELETDRTTQSASSQVDSAAATAKEVPEIDRMVEFLYHRTAKRAALKVDEIEKLFSYFGPLETTMIRSDKIRKGKNYGRGAVVFKSVLGAYSAVQDWKAERDKQKDDWSDVEKVFWAGGKEPAWLANSDAQTYPKVNSEEEGVNPKSRDQPSQGFKDSAFPSTPTPPITPRRNIHEVLNNASALKCKPGISANRPVTGLRSVPSFSSFSTAPATPKAASPFISATGSPSFHELTMIRLKNAQKRKEESEISERPEAKVSG